MNTTHEETPDDENTDDVDGRSLTREGLAEGGNDDDHKFDAVCYNGSSMSKNGWERSWSCEHLHIRLRPTISANQPKRS
jgi:hypothetical protein